MEILKGNRQFLLENIGNVVLFIPLGVALKWSGVKDVKKAGLLASLLIEVLQFTFALGTFERDDLIHNTFGAVIGAWCVGKIGEVRFALEETTNLMVYVSVYDGCDCDVIATPVIYKEG